MANNLTVSLLMASLLWVDTQDSQWDSQWDSLWDTVGTDSNPAMVNSHQWATVSLLRDTVSHTASHLWEVQEDTGSKLILATNN